MTVQTTIFALATLFTYVSSGSAACGQAFSMGFAPKPFEPQVLGPNTKQADPDAWQATFVFRNKEGGGCTATAIGERVVLTAAHCVGNGDKGDLQTASDTVHLTCQQHPSYPLDISADFALCYADLPIKLAGPFEVINLDAGITTKGKPLKLLGYGCRTEGGKDKTFGLLFEGDTEVFAAGVSNYVVTAGGSALCFGDSGGGAYAFPDEFHISRRLVAVNSRGDINQYSWLSLTSSDLFQNWAKSWSSQNSTSICGLNNEASGCHQ